LARGRTNKAIAQLLDVSDSTVKTHVLHIYDKLDVRTRLDLISLAIERGWVQDARPASTRSA
jgi:DNA-binding NarL/FixJ family response regulator